MAGDTRKTILDSFAASYNELSQYLRRRFGSKVETDDVLQDTFLRINNIAPEAEINNPRSYLFRVADNLATDHVRARQVLERRFTSEDIAEPADEKPSPERIADYRQRLGRLELAVQELPPRQRQVFLMHKLDGLSHGEIAAELGISKSAVEKLIMKALAHLRDRLSHLID